MSSFSDLYFLLTFVMKDLKIKYQLAIAELLFPVNSGYSYSKCKEWIEVTLFSSKWIINFDEDNIKGGNPLTERNLTEVLKSMILTDSNIKAWSYRGLYSVINHTCFIQVRNSISGELNTIDECATYLRMAKNNGFDEVKVLDQWLPLILYVS